LLNAPHLKELLMKLIVSTFLFAIIFFGCKKYPEDEGLIHFRSAPKRMEHFGPWYIKEYTVDGADSIPFVNAKYYWLNPITEVPHIYKGGQVTFSEDKKNVFLSTTFTTHTRESSWVIIELDKKNFKLVKEFNSKKYFIWFQNRN